MSAIKPAEQAPREAQTRRVPVERKEEPKERKEDVEKKPEEDSRHKIAEA